MVWKSSDNKEWSITNINWDAWKQKRCYLYFQSHFAIEYLTDQLCLLWNKQHGVFFYSPSWNNCRVLPCNVEFWMGYSDWFLFVVRKNRVDEIFIPWNHGWKLRHIVYLAILETYHCHSERKCISISATILDHKKLDFFELVWKIHSISTAIM